MDDGGSRREGPPERLAPVPLRLGPLRDRLAPLRDRLGSLRHRLAPLRDRLGSLWGNAWVKVITVVVASRIALTLIAVQTSAAFIGEPQRRSLCWATRDRYPNPLLRLWSNWDTGWYAGLARDGYPHPPANLKAWAFQPLYPMLMRVVSAPVGGDLLLAGVLISLACLVVSTYVVYRLALLDFDEATAWRAAWFFLLLPTSFTLSAALTESLFVMLAVTAFYAARTGRWAVACTLVALCSVTRSVGLLVAAALALEYLAQHGWLWRRPWAFRPRWDASAFAIAPVGLIAFALYGRQVTGDALIFQHVQYQLWSHERNNPLSTLWVSLQVAVQHPAGLRSLVILLTTGWLLVSIAAALARWLRPSYLLYTLAVILPPLSLGTSAWQSMYRYLAPAFPMAFVLARGSRSRTVETSLLISLALFQGMLMSLWTACFTDVVI